MNKKLRHVIIGVGAGVLNMHLPALKLDSVDTSRRNRCQPGFRQGSSR